MLGNVDLSKYSQLEQLSKLQLGLLKDSIHNVVQDYVIENIFMIGSFVFGLDKINDIDIIVCIKEYVDQDSLEIDNVKLYRQFDTEYSDILSERLNKKVHMRPYNIIDFMTDEAKRVNPPMYDLTNGIWINKSPGDVFPFHMVTIVETGKVVLIPRDDCGNGCCNNCEDDDAWVQYRLKNGEDVWDIGNGTIVEYDQFYSTEETVDEIMDVFNSTMSEIGLDTTKHTFIEPSAGDGVILRRLPEERRIGIDIDPKHDDIIDSDFLKWLPNDNKKYITLGNPPFGVSGDKVSAFVQHASKFSDVIALGTPDYFKMEVDDMNLVCNKQLSDNKYRLVDETETSIPIRMHFQVWVKTNMHVCL